MNVTLSVREFPSGQNLTGIVHLDATAQPTPDNGVQFYVGGTLLVTDTAAPYSATWDTRTVADGTYGLKAVAVYKQATRIADKSILVSISNGGGSGTQITLAGSMSDLAPSASRPYTATIKGASGATVTTGADSTTPVSFTQTAGAGSVTGTGSTNAVAGVATKSLTGGVAGPVTVRASATLSGPGATNSNTISFNVGQITTIRVNTGGASYVDGLGNVWAADNSYSGGNVSTTAAVIAGTSTPLLYQSHRWNAAPFSYTFANLVSGSYQVALKFAEIYYAAAGVRQFNVAINGTSVLTNFDVFAQAGGKNIALDKVFTAATVNGQIVVSFSPGAIENPMISAIQVVTAVPTVIQPPSVSGGLHVGEVDTVDPGTWTLSATWFDVHWQRSANTTTWTDIPGAIYFTYTLASADVGYYLRATVTAQVGATGTPSAPVASNTIGPIIATVPPPTTNRLALIKLGGGLTSYATRLSEYGLVVVSGGDTTNANPRTLVYANGMKIRADGGSGVSQSEAQALGYLTGVATPGYPALFADIRNTNYQQWFAAQMVTYARNQGAAGVFLDDMAMTPGTGVTLPNYTLAQFQDAMVGLCTAVGQALHANGLYLLANCNAYISQVQDDAWAEAAWISRNAAALNGAMSESFMTLRDGSNTARTTALGVVSAGWSTLVTQVEALGVDCIGLTYGPLSNALYGYASLLTQAKRSGSAFMWGADTDPATLLGRYTGTASVNLVAGTGVVS